MIRTADSEPTEGTNRVDDIPCFGHAAMLNGRKKLGFEVNSAVSVH